MSRLVDVTLWIGQDETWIGESGLPLEIGRQSRDEDDSNLCKVQDHGNQFRIAISPITSLGLPRQALRLELTASGKKLQLTNIHSRSTFHVAGEPTAILPQAELLSDGEFTIMLPENLTVKVVLLPGRDERGSLQSQPAFRTLNTDVRATGWATMSEAGAASGMDSGLNPARSFIKSFSDDTDQQRGHAAVDLVRQALSVVQKSAGSDEFFDAAARSTAAMVELDRAYVLLRNGDGWWVKAKFSTGSDTDAGKSDPGDEEAVPSGSRVLLQRVLDQRQTVIYEPESYSHTIGSSIMLLDRAVAAPILDEQEEIIGVLYGDRKFGSTGMDTPIGDLEATLLEVMAGAVSAGIARQRQEAIQASMTQFFSPAVTQRLQQDEDLLTGRDAEVTVLFCDIRGFSGIAERVGPERTIQWINDVLTQLSHCVIRNDGVLVDYIGDELMAMWGAPAEQPDHAVRACLAACQMLEQVEPLRERWLEITPDQFGVGIGINTGVASVGNTGSKVKFKYGPLGNTVNIASRMQGLSKQFGVSAIITGTTAEAMRAASASGAHSKLSHRKLASVRPFGVQEAVELFQLHGEPDDDWNDMVRRYESALNLFHQSDLTGAARELASLVHEHPNDTPSVVLLGRVVDAITQRVQSVDPIMQFNSK